MTAAPRPAAGTPRPYHFPAFERRQLENGLQLIVAPIHKLPVVTVVAVLDAGAVTEPAGKFGVAELAARGVLEGAAGYTGDALTEQLERLGTAIDSSVDWDATELTMTTLASRLPEAFAALANVLTAPTFPEAQLERLKGERLAELMQVESEPRTLADEQFERFVYRDGSRYQTPVGGTKASVAGLTRDDVVAFYEGRYRPAGATLIFAGDVTMAAAEQLVADALGSWSGAHAPSARGDDRAAADVRRAHIVHRDGAPQSELRVGTIGVPRAHPEYFPITVMNAVLGGLFGSRINLNLREAHGYTYGASSSFDWRRDAGPFVVSTAVASNVTAPAIVEILREIDRMRSEPIAESELSLATDYLDGVFPIRFETTAAVAAALAVLVVFGLSDDWYDQYRARIRAVGVDDVLRAARDYLHPEALQFVIVGDAAAIRDSVSELPVGEVQIHE